MEFNINLQDLVQQHFGFNVTTSSFEPPADVIPFGNIKTIGGGDKMVNGAPVVKHTAMGTPVFDYIKVGAGDYYDFQGKLKKYAAYDFPFECVVELSQPTMFEETYLKGGNIGSVNEILGVADWLITIRGFIINYDSKDYPTAAVNKFKKLISLPTELSIESPFLNMFDIENMLVLDRNIPQVEGALHYQPFTLICKSAKPYFIRT